MRTNKILKAVALVMVAVCMLFVMPTNMTAKAEATPTTYSLKYVESAGDWRIQYQYPWDPNGYHREVYYLTEAKDGDKLVIYDSPNELRLTLDKRFSNVTFAGTHLANVTATYIDEVYVLGNSTAVLNSDVGKAYVYNNGIANFNKNVGYLEVNQDAPSGTNVNVIGTVGTGVVNNFGTHAFTGYDFKEGGFVIANGGMIFKQGSHSLTPVAATPAPATPQAPADEYDSVPKTGETTNYFYLLGLAVVALFGASLVAKKVK